MDAKKYINWEIVGFAKYSEVAMQATVIHSNGYGAPEVEKKSIWGL